jgi:hypothetical protein
MFLTRVHNIINTLHNYCLILLKYYKNKINHSHSERICEICEFDISPLKFDRFAKFQHSTFKLLAPQRTQSVIQIPNALAKSVNFILPVSKAKQFALFQRCFSLRIYTRHGRTVNRIKDADVRSVFCFFHSH